MYNAVRQVVMGVGDVECGCHLLGGRGVQYCRHFCTVQLTLIRHSVFSYRLFTEATAGQEVRILFGYFIILLSESLSRK